MSIGRIRRHRIKRLIDALLALLGLALALPAMLAIAAAIRLGSSGPAIYSQERLGRHRRPFRVFKFRTMRADAERDTGPVWSWAGDPRVTRLGHVLRTTHLDELPQLWNVLRGEMSFVGPRPERAHFVEQFESLVPGYVQRFDVLPGITGLGQIRSGYDCSIRSVQRKTRYDRLYVARACAWLDARILWETVVQLAVPASIAQSVARFAASLNPVPRRDQLGSWSKSVPPPSNAASVPARGNLRRFGTGAPGPVAAGQA